MYSHGPPHMVVQRQDDQHEHTFSSYVRIRDVVLKTCLGRWTIGRSGERGSGISVLPAWHDDDDDVAAAVSVCLHFYTLSANTLGKDIYIYIYIYIYFPRVLVLWEMQTASSRVWTWVALSFSYNIIHCTMSISINFPTKYFIYSIN